MIEHRTGRALRPRSVTTHISWPPVYRDRLVRLSAERGLSMAELIRRAVDLMLSSGVTLPDDRVQAS